METVKRYVLFPEVMLLVLFVNPNVMSPLKVTEQHPLCSRLNALLMSNTQLRKIKGSSLGVILIQLEDKMH